jgi:hypothetical protein
MHVLVKHLEEMTDFVSITRTLKIFLRPKYNFIRFNINGFIRTGQRYTYPKLGTLWFVWTNDIKPNVVLTSIKKTIQ